MSNLETYWRAMEDKNKALTEVRTISAKIARLRESLNRANCRFHEAEATAIMAFQKLSDAEREEVQNTNTWGNT